MSGTDVATVQMSISVPNASRADLESHLVGIPQVMKQQSWSKLDFLYSMVSLTFGHC